jgi:hypothetical protein
MFALMTPEFALSGAMNFPSGQARATTVSRRARRVPVLDLAVGAVLSDLGYSAGDLDYRLTVAGGTRDQYLFIRDLIGRYPGTVLSCPDGCYFVLLSGLSFDDADIVLTAQVVEVL